MGAIAFSFLRPELRTLEYALGILVLVTLLAGLWALYLHTSGNFRTVEAGVFYRSGQLSPNSLEDKIIQYRIATVINLRGAHPEKQWYRDELAKTTAMGVTQIDFKIPGRRHPGLMQMQQLQRIMQTAAHPILVHCEGGADRSGLAAALFQLTINHKPEEIADDQLSFYYGHFPWLIWRRSSAMDVAFGSYIRHHSATYASAQ